jgi:hypothetical protein
MEKRSENWPLIFYSNLPAFAVLRTTFQLRRNLSFKHKAWAGFLAYSPFLDLAELSAADERVISALWKRRVFFSALQVSFSHSTDEIINVLTLCCLTSSRLLCFARLLAHKMI